MPTINDAIVVSGSGYSTEGNGGRKLAWLDNGNLYSVMKDSTSYFIRKSTDGTNWSSFKTATYTTVQDVCLSTNGKYIYMAFSFNNSSFGVIGFDESGNVVSSVSVDNANQTALGNVSLTINEAKTELHAAWVSRNSSYQSSFNVRYAKGTINGDGTVTWGAVEQVTKINGTGSNFQNPSISVKGNVALILAQSLGVYLTGTTTTGGASSSSIVLFKRDNTLSTGNIAVDNSWSWSNVIKDNTYAQSSPSAIYVPQSINGLANGRIWVAWHGTDSTDTTFPNIRVSYSDDLGVTWSTMQKLTSGNAYTQTNATITANNNNEIFILWNGFSVSNPSSYNIRKIKNANDVWGSIVEYTASGKTNLNPSSLFDTSFSLSFSDPLFIYSANTDAKVGFYGSWSVETISPTIAERGQILNRQNILTYNITSDSTIGTVTEKINGVVVGTKTLTSGQNTTINITQAQWDAIPYGKYRNDSAGRNTIEIVTPNNTFTYTFEKWFDNTLDVISATKAVKDSKDYYLPSAKKILSDAINSKGGSTTPTQSIETMANYLSNVQSSKVKTGTAISPSLSYGFVNHTGGTIQLSNVVIDTSALGFKPIYVYIYRTTKDIVECTSYFKDKYYSNGSNYADSTMSVSGNGYYVRAVYEGDNLRLPVNATNASYSYIAVQ